MKKKIILSIVGVLVLSLISYFAYEHYLYAETDNAQVEAHAVLLASKISGYIRDIRVSDGQKVKKDQVLVQIDDRDYRSAVESAVSELLSLEARKQDAEKNFRRVRELFQKNVVTQQQNDTATAAYNEIRAKYDSTATRVTQARLNLENTQIKAPSDGIIAKTSAEVGQLASPGVPLVGFVSSSARWIIANYKETEIERIKPGSKVYATIDAFSNRSFSGEVESIYPATGATFSLLPPDNATGNFTKVVQRVPVKIKLDQISADDIEKLQAGLSAIVKIKIR